MTNADYQTFPGDGYLAQEHDLDPDMFPLLFNPPTALLFAIIPRPIHTSTPEFVYIDSEKINTPIGVGDIVEWNLAWEAGQLRQSMFHPKRSEIMKKLGIHEDSNIYFLPFNRRHHYHSYLSLFHLIPRRTLNFNHLPLLRQGIWPVGWFRGKLGDILPCDFDEKLAQAFSFHIWPLINSGSKASSFSKNDPLRILAHNLDFWLPSIFKVVENRLNQFERAAIETEEQLRMIEETRLFLPPDVEPVRPLNGGIVWAGEEDAWEATKEMVELADSDGNLRAIIDAIKSNRIEEDFSDIWSNAREDFERKLYKKRSKIKITFVELTDTLPVHGPDSEFHENLLWEDFFGILDQKEKRIVVCLRNGTTKLGDIAKEMGWANHSPVSKALKKIREKASKFLRD
jgi:hypothetical protein